MNAQVVVLAGGTGGAKLARGVLDVVGAANLTVIANTGDDILLHGLHISPDPDLITYWLADRIDQERGWGFATETFAALAQLKQYGSDDAWFQLGDRDLATHLVRTNLLRAGARLTDAAASIARGLGVDARVLPMSDDPVTTYVRTDGRWRHFQEYMIKDGARQIPETYEFRGAQQASPTPEVLAALATAEIVLIGPSNPIASIGPILAVPCMRGALQEAPAPVVAISPLVDGRPLKGPTDKFMAAASLELSHGGVAAAYDGLIDGIVCDSTAAQPASIPSHTIDTSMHDSQSRKRVSSEALNFASSRH